MKRKVQFIAMVAILFSLLQACSSIPKPGELPITERDEKIYKDPVVKAQNQEEEAVAIALLPARQKTENEGLEVVLTKNIESKLNDNLSAIEYFDVVARDELGDLADEAMLNDLENNDVSNLNIPKATLALRFKITDMSMQEERANSGTKLGMGLLNVAGKVGGGSSVDDSISATKYKGRIAIDFRLIDLESNKKLMSQRINAISDKLVSKKDKDDREFVLIDAAEKAVRQFTSVLAKKYGPQIMVIETRGEGEVARINVGKNFGLDRDVRVEFYKNKISPVDPNAKPMRSPVGYGTILEVEDESAWVWVENFDEVEVMMGVLAQPSATQEYIK